MEFINKCRYNFKYVSDNAQMSNFENRGIFILINGYNVIRTLHPYQMLDGSGDTTGNI